jgi:hypothetical protein
MKTFFLFDTRDLDIVSEADLDIKTKNTLNYAYALNNSSLRWLTKDVIRKLAETADT